MCSGGVLLSHIVASSFLALPIDSNANRHSVRLRKRLLFVLMSTVNINQYMWYIQSHSPYAHSHTEHMDYFCMRSERKGKKMRENLRSTKGGGFDWRLQTGGEAVSPGFSVDARQLYRQLVYIFEAHVAVISTTYVPTEHGAKHTIHWLLVFGNSWAAISAAAEENIRRTSQCTWHSGKIFARTTWVSKLEKEQRQKPEQGENYWR